MSEDEVSITEEPSTAEAVAAPSVSSPPAPEVSVATLMAKLDEAVSSLAAPPAPVPEAAPTPPPAPTPLLNAARQAQNRVSSYYGDEDPKPAIEPAQRLVANPTGRCAVLDATGHSELAWDTRDPDSVEAARKEFDKLVSQQRYLAFKVNDDGTKGEQIKAFDPEIEDMILIPPMTGG